MNARIRQGYTFVELMVVLLIIGVFFALVAPRLAPQQAHQTPVSGLVELLESQARESASAGKAVYLFLDLDRQRWWVQEDPKPPAESLPDASALPEGCAITRIVTRDADSSDGFLRIAFFPDGTSDLAFFYCTEPGSGTRFTVLLNPYTGAETFDGEVSFADRI